MACVHLGSHKAHNLGAGTYAMLARDAENGKSEDMDWKTRFLCRCVSVSPMKTGMSTYTFLEFWYYVSMSGSLNPNHEL